MAKGKSRAMLFVIGNYYVVLETLSFNLIWLMLTLKYVLHMHNVFTTLFDLPGYWTFTHVMKRGRQ